MAGRSAFPPTPDASTFAGSLANVLSDTERSAYTAKAITDARIRQDMGCTDDTAIKLYLTAAIADPSVKLGISEELMNLLKSICDELFQSDPNNLCYLCACIISVYHDVDGVLSDMGSLLYGLGLADEAISCYRKALSINPNLASARENLDNLHSSRVDRWHFLMLNDSIRNYKYRNAIRNAIADGCRTVLDIGSGTGILSMMACEADAAEVYACDSSKVMYDLSNKALDINKPRLPCQRIHLINSDSKDLVVRKHLSQKVDLIVTETLDCGLFGEDILSTLSHAHKHLLKKTGVSRIIPAGASLYCSVIECDHIRHHHRWRSRADPLTGVSYGDTVFADYTGQPMNALPNPDDFSPYTTYDIRNLKGGCRQLSYPIKLLDVNFNDEKSIDHLLQGHSETFRLRAEKDGRVDAVVMWFTVALNETNQLSSNPWAPSPSIPEHNTLASCWHPAVFPVTKTTLTTQLIKLGTELTILLECSKDVISLQLTDTNSHSTTTEVAEPVKTELTSELHTHMIYSRINNLALPCGCRSDCSLSDTKTNHPAIKTGHVNTGKSSLYETQKENALDVVMADALTSKTEKRTEAWPVKEGNCYYLPTHDIHRLNDAHNNTVLCNSMKKAIDRLSSSGEPVNLLVMDRGFSPLPLQAMKMGVTSCTVVTEDNYQRRILTELAEFNRIKGISFCKDLDECMEKGDKYSLVYVDIVHPDGTLRQHVLGDIALARLMLQTEGGASLPSKLKVFAAGINSRQLSRCSRVLSTQNTCGLDVTIINDYQTTVYRDIDLQTLDYENVTSAEELLCLDFNSQIVDSSGMPDFMTSNHIATLKASTDRFLGEKVLTGILFWFELWFDAETHISTLDAGRYWNHAAVVFGDELECKPEHKAAASIVDGCLSIRLIS